MSIRDAGLAVIALAGFIWMVAVVFGFLAGPLHLTKRQSFIGRLARMCRAVALLSP